MDDARRKILARRAQFVAAAVAGLTAEGCHKDDLPRADPSVVDIGPPASAEPLPTAPPVAAPAVEPEPAPCLSVPYPSADGGAPRPCLKPMSPHACLKVRRPE